MGGGRGSGRTTDMLLRIDMSKPFYIIVHNRGMIDHIIGLWEKHRPNDRLPKFNIKMVQDTWDAYFLQGLDACIYIDHAFLENVKLDVMDFTLHLAKRADDRARRC